MSSRDFCRAQQNLLGPINVERGESSTKSNAVCGVGEDAGELIPGWFKPSEVQRGGMTDRARGLRRRQ